MAIDTVNRLWEKHWLMRAKFLALLAVFLGTTGLFGAEVRLPSDEEIRKITTAMPSNAAVKPAKPRKLLVIGHNPSHPPVPYAAKAFEIMGERTGAFKAVVSDDGSIFEPERLREFDAVLINNWHGWNPFLPVSGKELAELPPAKQRELKEREAGLRRSLLDFVAGGKGVAGIHAATVGLGDWDEYYRMIGGRYTALPWMEAIIKVEAPDHPVCRAFKGKTFRIEDEIYEFKEPYSRESLRILLSVDTSQTTAPKSSRYGEPIRTDNDYGLSWVRSYGKGRVFYCALGHFSETYWNPEMLQHFLDGVQFALGDLAADTTPTKRLKE